MAFPLLSFFSEFMALDWLIYGALILLLAIQIGAFKRAKSLPKYRLRIRLALNILLWAVVLFFAIQPQWKFSNNTARVLLLSENIPAPTVQKAKDSLKITESFTISEVERQLSKNPDYVHSLGSIYLLGQDFRPQTLSQLAGNELHWIPFYSVEALQNIRWKAILRKGEFQEVIGKIELTEPKVLKINYGNQVLDSILLPKGLRTFQLRFPAFAVGRTETVLLLEEKPLHKIAFYSRKPSASVVHFVMDSPDFESKSLAEWLGKNGNQVEMFTTIAKNTQTKVAINRTGTQKTKLPDIVMTDPANVSHPLVKKSVDEGKSVFFYNFTQPEQSLKRINTVLGTKWHLKKISNEESRPLGNGITALPYELEPNSNQTVVDNYPVAIQKTGGRVGVSLLNETFSLKLRGDSLAYSKLWSGILQQLNPPFEGNISAIAPLVKDTRSVFVLNKFPLSIRDISVANDTARMQSSSVNTLTATADYTFRKTGWQSFQDSLEVYVEDDFVTSRQIREVLRAHNETETVHTSVSEHQLTAQLPDWAWLVLFLLCLTALWIEPKLTL